MTARALLITGVNGVGKSTLVARLTTRPGVTAFSASRALMGHFGIAAGDYAALDAIPLDRRLAASHLLIERAIAQTPGTLLLDAHLLTFECDPPRDCGGPWLARLFRIVLVTAPAAVIDARLAADEGAGRVRRWADPHEPAGRQVRLLATRQELLARHAARTARRNSVGLLHLDHSGPSEPAVNILNTLIESAPGPARPATAALDPSQHSD